jgi:adenine-specific DNA-methyltransferase
MEEEIRKNNIWFGSSGNGVPRIKKFLQDADEGLTPQTLWLADEVSTNDAAKKHQVGLLLEGELFDTPKPEELIGRVAHIASSPGDIVMDSFLGSGTTCAVAHKMGRRYIGIEMGEHAVTHCVPRLKKVVDGEQGGISEAMKWQGGGGFRFYRLGEAVFDEEGKINRAISFSTLAAHVWFSETGTPLSGTPDSPWLGAHDGTGYYLLYNGILGDKCPGGGNVLTRQLLAAMQSFDGPKIIYGEMSRLSAERLRAEMITFKQIPYDVKAR